MPKKVGTTQWRRQRHKEYLEKKDKGSPKLAIRYAKRIIRDGAGKTPTDIAPGTKVYELVEELVKYLPEKIRQNYS